MKTVKKINGFFVMNSNGDILRRNICGISVTSFEIYDSFVSPENLDMKVLLLSTPEEFKDTSICDFKTKLKYTKDTLTIIPASISFNIE